MPPKQRGPQIPRQGQGMRTQGQRPMPYTSQQAVVPRPTPIAGNQPVVSQRELERARQTLQSELEKVFAQVPPTPVVPPQPQRVEHHQAAQQAASHADGERHAPGKASVGEMQPAYVQGLLVENASQKRQRLRQAYLLTELVGRPRAYDI